MTDTDTGSWTDVWAGMANKVGMDLSGGSSVHGADPIERSTIRRYLEPLEFDCPLHYDPAVARAHGFSDVTAPYSSYLTFTIAPMWVPGRTLFTSADRDAQPESSPINGDDLRVSPEITGFFATDIELDFIRPAVAGEHLSKRGNVLMSCSPKWISVGRGAFLTLQSEYVNDSGQVVGRIRNTVFAYEPVGPPPERRSGAAIAERPAETPAIGEGPAPVTFPLSVYRLVMEAGACRDFNSIHHNSEYAKATGAPEMYASTSFLLGMWEKAVRSYIGLDGTIESIRGFRMKRFNPAGSTVLVRAEPVARRVTEDVVVTDLRIWCENSGEVTVGPGLVTVTMPK